MNKSPAFAVGCAVILVYISSCGTSGSAPIVTHSSSSCGRDGEVSRAFTEYAHDDTYAVVLATVKSVQEDKATLVGGERGAVYTPIQLSNLETLSGKLPNHQVFSAGGTASGVQYNVEDGPTVGLVDGGRVLLAVRVVPVKSPLGDEPNGPLITQSYPVLQDGTVVVTGGCLGVTKDTPMGRKSTVSVKQLDVKQEVQTVTKPQGIVPLAVLREALKK